MINKHYHILQVSKSTSKYNLTKKYKKLCKKFLDKSSPTESEIDSFYKVNAAYAILSRKNVKKYYDILIKIEKNQRQKNYNLLVINKYMKIVNNYAKLGLSNAHDIIDGNKEDLKTVIQRPMIISFLMGTIRLYCWLPKPIFTSLSGFLFLLLGIVFITLGITQIIEYELSFLGVLAIIWGGINLFINYRFFYVEIINEKIDVKGNLIDPDFLEFTILKQANLD